MALRTHRLEDLTWSELRDVDRDRMVVVVPVGATEQHGPHLPLDTDSYLCTQVVEAAAQRVHPEPVLVAPTLRLGVSEHHISFPGTLTLSSGTFLAAVKELCDSLARHEFRRQLIVNGHGGNSALIAQAVQDVGWRDGVRAVTLQYWDLASEVIDEIRESPPGGMGHACEFETSLMLHLRPDSVLKAEIRREIAVPRFDSERLDMFLRGPLVGAWQTDELSRSGVLGAPDLATAEKGRRIFEACVSRLVGIIEEVRTAALP